MTSVSILLAKQREEESFKKVVGCSGMLRWGFCLEVFTPLWVFLPVASSSFFNFRGVLQFISAVMLISQRGTTAMLGHLLETSSGEMILLAPCTRCGGNRGQGPEGNSCVLLCSLNPDGTGGLGYRGPW